MPKEHINPARPCFAFHITEKNEMQLMIPNELDQAARHAMETVCVTNKLCDGFSCILKDCLENPEKRGRAEMVAQALGELLKAHTIPGSPVFLGASCLKSLRSEAKTIVLSLNKEDILAKRLPALIERMEAESSQGAVNACVEGLLPFWEHLCGCDQIYHLMILLCTVSRSNVLNSVEAVEVFLKVINAFYLFIPNQEMNGIGSKIKARIHEFLEKLKRN